MPRTVPEIAQQVRRGLSTLDSTYFAAAAVYEAPFRAERIEGRDAILARLATRTGSPDEVTSVASGLVVESPVSVGILTLEDGLITAYRDYPNRPSVSARAVFDRFLAASVENRWDDLADCYAEDVTLEMPFTLPGAPRATKGREELRRRFRRVGEARQITKADNVIVHETADPAVLVAEFDLHQEMGGETFVATYVMVMTVEDGLITHTRDYTDTAAAADRLKAWSPAGTPAG